MEIRYRNVTFFVSNYILELYIMKTFRFETLKISPNIFFSFKQSLKFLCLLVMNLRINYIYPYKYPTATLIKNILFSNFNIKEFVLY